MEKLSNQQYKFVAEMLWGCSPTDRNWAEGTKMFQSQAPLILNSFPMLDKSDFNIKRCRSFVKGLRNPTGLLTMYISIRKTKRNLEYVADGKTKPITTKGINDYQHICKIKSVIYGYHFHPYHPEMDFKIALEAGCKFI